MVYRHPVADSGITGETNGRRHNEGVIRKKLSTGCQEHLQHCGNVTAARRGDASSQQKADAPELLLLLLDEDEDESDSLDESEEEDEEESEESDDSTSWF